MKKALEEKTKEAQALREQARLPPGSKSDDLHIMRVQCYRMPQACWRPCPTADSDARWVHTATASGPA